MIKLKRSRSHHNPLPHKAHSGERLKECPACGGPVHLEQIEFKYGQWVCEDCSNHYFFTFIFKEGPSSPPVYYTPLEIEKRFPVTNTRENPRDYMLDKFHRTDGKISIFYGGD